MSKHNRSNKILDLVKNQRDDSEQDIENIRNSSNTPNIPNYPVAEEAMSRTSSPLPPGAENIAVEMKDVWQDIFADENITTIDRNVTSPTLNPTQYQNNIDIPQSIPIHSAPNQDQNNFNSPQSSPSVLELNPGQSNVDSSQPTPLLESHYSPQLTPFDLEVPTSYEASPMVEIQELVNESSLNTELLLATPMPSPVNLHVPCTNDFCSQHVPCKVSIAAESTPNTSQTKDTIPKKGKKRLRRQSEWSSVKRKCLKNLGKRHVTKKGEMKDEKTLGPPCKCRNKCSTKISQQQRVECFSRFWKLGDRAKQWDYIVKYTDKLKKKRCLNQDIPNNRKYTYKYCLPLISGSTDSQHEMVEVCQKMFLSTLSVSTRILRTAWEKYDGSTSVEADQRGRHKNHKIIISEAMVQSVCDHVKSFAPIESHYIRKDSKKLYLSGDLSIAKMHKLYLEWYDATKYTDKALKERQYRDIVNANFNLGFHIPKKDQCDDCHVFRQKKDPTEEEIIKFKRHDENKKIARNLKNKDKDNAIRSEGTIVTAVFDFEKVLTCPHGNISIFYYKRKLSCLNFTVFDMGKKKGLCYMWDESIAKKGANEVSSCLLDFIERNAKEGVKEFRFWSDNCAGQNRNRIVYSLYVYAAKKFNVSIYHRFMEKGHTQNEGDSVHSVIERASQTKIIYTPEEWRLLARWAKNEEPYEVYNMGREKFFDFKSQINNKVWQKNIKGDKINWNKIKEVHVYCDDSNKLLYKYDFSLEDSDILVLRGHTRNALQTELKPAYSHPLKIPLHKYKDLISMCTSGVIPSEYSSYFRALPHQTIVGETEDSTDDDGPE